MVKIAMLSFLATSLGLLGGCVTSSFPVSGNGDSEVKWCLSEADIAAVSWTGAIPQGLRRPLCILFLKELQPGPGTKRERLWKALASPPSALVVETHSADLLDANPQIASMASAGTDVPLEKISIEAEFLGNPGEGRNLCVGEITLRTSGRDAKLPVRFLRPASREEIDAAVPVPCPTADARFSEQLNRVFTPIICRQSYARTPSISFSFLSGRELQQIVFLSFILSR